MNQNTQPIGRVSAVPVEALFILSAISQYSGAIIAKRLFDEVSPSTVAVIRVASAAAVLACVGKVWRRRWTRVDLISAAVFGVATAAMNLFFYLALERIDLGIGVAIEFIGPITVAATRTRSRRNWVALLSATSGVMVLAGLELNGGDPLGLFFMLCASACWATYIVMGSKLSAKQGGIQSLGLGLIMGAFVVLPFGSSDLSKVFSSGNLVVRCVAVGMLSTALAYGIDQIVLKRMPTRRFALMSALLPVVALIGGILFLGERPTLLDGLGVSLVLVGVAIQERTT